MSVWVSKSVGICLHLSASQIICATSCGPSHMLAEGNLQPACTVVICLCSLWCNLQILNTQLINPPFVGDLQIIKQFRESLLMEVTVAEVTGFLVLCIYEYGDLQCLCCNSSAEMRRMPCSMIKNSLSATGCCISMDAE